jgi:hypothetical protein
MRCIDIEIVRDFGTFCVLLRFAAQISISDNTAKIKTGDTNACSGRYRIRIKVFLSKYLTIPYNAMSHIKLLRDFGTFCVLLKSAASQHKYPYQTSPGDKILLKYNQNAQIVL